MIQILIPTTQNLVDKIEPYKKYTAFDFHVNGAYHASVRYSHLCTLHERLIDNFGFRLNGPEFPPKKIWRTLDAKAINERREGLAKYFQALIQLPDVARHPILENAFLEFQVNSFQPTLQTVSVDIYLPDGHAVKVECYADDSTSFVMKKFYKIAHVDEKHTDSFGLFLGKDREEKSNGMVSSVLFDYVCCRWLKNFESPYISQQLANRKNAQNGEATDEKYKLLIRRVTWDPSVEEPLLSDPGATKLLYLQAMNDVQHNFIEMSNEVKNELSEFAEVNDYKNFLSVCHAQSGYGFEVLDSVVSDYPTEGKKCCLKVGRRMIVLQYIHEGKLVQALLRSHRIRTWKISHAENFDNDDNIFQLEYVLGSGVDLMTFHTTQAVLISHFLQSIADEILRFNRPESPAYKFDDSIQTKVISNLKSSMDNSIVSENLSIKSESSSTESGSTAKEKIKPLLQIISYQMPFENESFADLTDADL